jgi:transposase
MIQQLQALADRQGGAAIYVGFEAGPHGFWFYDEMENAGIRCAPLAPTEMERASDARVQKNDDKDAERILEVVRAWVLAGKENSPLVAVPDPETRRDREPVRMRVRIGCQVAKTKTRIRSLLARHDLNCDGAFDRKHIEALHKLAGKIDPSLGVVLKQMLRELKCWEQEQRRADRMMMALARKERYRHAVEVLLGVDGAGMLTALAIVVEFGDPKRFENRQQVGAFLGLVPTMADSGERTGRLGHITKKGSAQLRRLLCQAVWGAMKEDPALARAYDRWCSKHPRRKMVFIVGKMRKMGIRLWHELQRAYGGKPVLGAPGSQPGRNTPVYWRMRFPLICLE